MKLTKFIIPQNFVVKYGVFLCEGAYYAKANAVTPNSLSRISLLYINHLSYPVSKRANLRVNEDSRDFHFNQSNTHRWQLEDIGE